METKIVYEQMQVSKNIRNKLAVVALGVLVGGILAACADIQVTTTYPQASIAEVAPTPTANPREPILQEIASKAREAGKETAFDSTDEFTPEFFEKVRKSTFVIRAKFDSASNFSSAWAVYKDNDAVYFATSLHTLEQGETNAQKLFFQRPFIDSKPFTSIAWEEVPDTEIVDPTNPGSKNIIIKCYFPKDVRDSIPVLPHINNYSFKPDEKVLNVGFPDEFENKENKNNNKKENLEYITQGQVLSVRESPEAKGLFSGYGMTDRGISGSPVVVKDSQNEPVVVGIVWGINLENINKALITELNFPPSLQ